MANDYEKRLLRVLDYVYDNLDGDLSLDTLADVAALSRFHFHRVFTAVTGETLAGFIRRVRLHRAANELLSTNAPVAEIAHRVGYDNTRSFSRSFRDAFGRTPSGFRAHARPVPPLRLGKRGETQMYDVDIQDQPDRRLGVIEHRGDYMGIGKAFEVAGSTVIARGLGPKAGAMIGLYFHDPANTATEDLRSAAGFELTEDAEISDPLSERRVHGGKYAILTHTGPYTGLAAAYQYLFGDWLASSGEMPREEPPLEIYVTSPMDTAPEDLVTRIGVPLL